MPGGARSLALWRPGERHLHWRAAPPNWLGPSAFWLPGAPLLLPCAPTGLAAYDPPPPSFAAPAPRRTPRARAAALSVLPLQQAPLAAAG